MRQTSLATSKLLTTAALSSARETVDGREAIALLRHLAEAASLAALRATDAVCDLAHGDTTSATVSLTQAAVHLAGTPTAVHRVGEALQRHEGCVHAQGLPVQEETAPDQTTVKVSDAQRRALASLARGDAVLREAHGVREIIAAPGSYLSVRATTVDALASRGLVSLKALPEHPGHHSLHVTAAGIRALLAASSEPRRRPTRPTRTTAAAAAPKAPARTTARARA